MLLSKIFVVVNFICGAISVYAVKFATEEGFRSRQTNSGNSATAQRIPSAVCLIILKMCFVRDNDVRPEVLTSPLAFSKFRAQTGVYI